MKKSLRDPLFLTLFVAAVGVLLVVLMAVGVLNEYVAQLLTLSGIYAIIALGLNLISGFTGQLALGHAGLMAIGAYTASTLVMQVGIPIFPAILAGGVVTGLFGLLIGIPTLRLRGDYLAITTLGMGEVIRVILVNLEGITGGAAGLKGVPPFLDSGNVTLDFIAKFLWVFVFLVLTVAGMSNLIRSSTGLALKSIREDEVSAGAMGVHTAYYKIFAFTLSAAVAGVGGGLYAFFLGYINPQMFTWIKSIDFVIIVVLGGLGSITGTLFASVLVVFALDLLWFLQDWRLVIYGLVLVLLMRFRPQGLMGRRELRLIGSPARIRAFLVRVRDRLRKPKGGPDGGATDGGVTTGGVQDNPAPGGQEVAET